MCGSKNILLRDFPHDGRIPVVRSEVCGAEDVRVARDDGGGVVTGVIGGQPRTRKTLKMHRQVARLMGEEVDRIH